MLEFQSLANYQLPDYIRTLGYPTMFLVMIMEGPIATLIAAFLSSLGFFNIFIVFFLSLLGDILGDLIFYAIGFWGGAKILEKTRQKMKIKPKILARLEKLFEKHGKKTIFGVKSTTGLCWITFMAAGALKMNLRDFLKGSIGGGLIWSSFLVIAGYFFGFAFINISKYISYAGIIIICSVIIFYIGLSLYKKNKSKKIISTDSDF